MTERRRDELFAGDRDDRPFVFDEQVAAVFADMIRRSVPGYATLLDLIGVLAARVARPGLRLYDLGCSLGAVAAAMRAVPLPDGCRVIAVDNAPPMVERARHALAAQPGAPFDVICADIRDFAIEDAALVVLNYTLQFVPVSGRLDLLQDIAAGLIEGGALVVSEKTLAADDEQERLFTDLHDDFRRLNGYSDLEISRKRQALERVLIPESLDTHRERLATAGFRRVDQWFRCGNFVSLLAWK